EGIRQSVWFHLNLRVSLKFNVPDIGIVRISICRNANALPNDQAARAAGARWRIRQGKCHRAGAIPAQSVGGQRGQRKPTPVIPPPPAWLAGALLVALLGLYCVNRFAPLLASTMGVGPQ